MAGILEDLVGSSRRTLLTMMVSSRSVNHPEGLHHFLVSVGEAGKYHQAQKPMRKVRAPSIAKSHLHPASP